MDERTRQLERDEDPRHAREVCRREGHDERFVFPLTAAPPYVACDRCAALLREMNVQDWNRWESKRYTGPGAWVRRDDRDWELWKAEKLA
jgi:hypothetical protein